MVSCGRHFAATFLLYKKDIIRTSDERWDTIHLPILYIVQKYQDEQIPRVIKGVFFNRTIHVIGTVFYAYCMQGKFIVLFFDDSYAVGILPSDTRLSWFGHEKSFL